MISRMFHAADDEVFPEIIFLFLCDICLCMSYNLYIGRPIDPST